MSDVTGDGPIEEGPPVDPVAADEAVFALAPTPQALQSSQAELARLLEVAGIQLVVFVDDEFEVTIDELIDALRDIPADRRNHVPHLGDDINFEVPEADENVWIDYVSERWEQLSRWERAITGADALARAGHSELRDQPNAGAVGPLIPNDMTRLLSPTEWEADGEHLLDAAANTATLILLDRHFGEHQDAGTFLLQGVFQHPNSDYIRAGIVTNSVTRSGEVGLWKELVKTFGLPPDRFVVISKENLAGETLTFAQALKVASLTQQFEELKTKVAFALDAAQTKAFETLDAIGPYAFERLVFASSHIEGVWEPETLLRLATISSRRHALASLREDDTIHDDVRTARQIASVETNRSSETTAQADALARRLQHDEVFEPADYINAVHLPLELGDVFQKRTGTARFVLLAQPCDLMVRGGGKRLPEPEFLILVELKTTKPSADSMHWYEIPFFEPSGDPVYIVLKRSYPVPAEALDLCVYNTNGSSELSINATAPPRLTPHWDARHEIHRAWAETAIAQVLDAPAGTTRSLVSRAVFRCSNQSLAGATLTNNQRTVRFNLTRVGRLRQPASLELLGTYLAHQGRMAFEGRLKAD